MAENQGVNITLFGDMSKVGVALIEKLGEAGMTWFEPRKIRRKAGAEASAALTFANTEIEIADIQRRAEKRWIEEEIIKQQNIERIVSESFGHLRQDADPKRIDNDWLLTFLEKCRNTSTDDIRGIWARLLASEANRSNSVSKQLLNIISLLSRPQAIAFQFLCGACWDSDILVIFDLFDEYLKANGVDYRMLQNLISAGLISRHAENAFIQLSDPPASWNMGGRRFEIYIDEKTKTSKLGAFFGIEAGLLVFTQAGMELNAIFDPRFDQYFFEQGVTRWQEKDSARVASVWPR